MLATLRVKNLALVEQLRVDFQPGLNIITGETGAGKSILAGALNLLLGGRADKSLIRSGEDACGAEALFQLENAKDIDDILDEYGVEHCQDGQLVIRRIIRHSGSSQTLINDSPVTLQVLKRLGDFLVDLHGPHDHQSLLSQEWQRDILDAFGQAKEERGLCAQEHAACMALRQQARDLSGNSENVEERMDMLSFRIEEIESANVQETEEEEIQREHEILGNAQRIQELAGQVLYALDDSETSAYEQLVGTRQALDELARLLPDGQAWSEEMDTVIRGIQELSTSIRGIAEDVESSPVRLEWLDQRLAEYRKIRRKYGPEIRDVLHTLHLSQQELHDLETRGEQLEEIRQQLRQQQAVLSQTSIELRKKRKTAARNLSSAVKKELKALGLEHAVFEVQFEETEPGAQGMDEIDFLFAPNKGEPAKPLRIIASSGEISRVMLAMKTVLADHDRVPVLVFDEIDANIGGTTGNAVGRKLHDVAQRHQVICITHLPQVAVFGQAHFAVEKYVRDERTFSSISRLEDEARVEEVARMLGGRDLTSITLDHAREMLGFLENANTA
jgi:DNA repair protein RecN (Recombination protein N)